MQKRLLAGILSAGMLLGTVLVAQPATQHHSTPVRYAHRRQGRARHIGTHALGGAAIGGLVGGRRGVLLGGGMGAGAGALRHRRRRFR